MPGAPVPRTTIDVLDNRIRTVERGMENLSHEMVNLSTKIDTQTSSLSAKLDERGKTQWPTLIAGGSFVLGVTLAIGTLAYRPVISDISRLERRQEIDESQIVPRGEHQEKWRANDFQLSNLQRQLDELGKKTGDVYTARDALIELRNRLDRFEFRTGVSPPRGGP